MLAKVFKVAMAAEIWHLTQQRCGTESSRMVGKGGSDIICCKADDDVFDYGNECNHKNNKDWVDGLGISKS